MRIHGGVGRKGLPKIIILMQGALPYNLSIRNNEYIYLPPPHENSCQRHCVCGVYCVIPQYRYNYYIISHTILIMYLIF